jgi:predicted dehydrogenase
MVGMPNKLRWGVLSTAKIALTKVLPGMQQGEQTEIAAIASRDLDKALQAAARLGIARAYGSYEELLADAEIDAIYNPLPNHLHLPWTIRAAEAGKHVLCEKPIGLNVAEVRQLIAVREQTGVQIAEAFMIRCHPQWLRVRALLNEGRIGQLRSFSGIFSYNNQDHQNIRNIAAYGGGGLYDIGCYLVQAARFTFGAEPRRVASLLERDPQLKIDRLSSALLDFEGGQATLTCSTQILRHQRVVLLGTTGRIEIEIPFNAGPDQPVRILIDNSGELDGSSTQVETIPAADQYMLQGEAFARAVRGEGTVPVPLEDSLGTMATLDALFRSAQTGQWEAPHA